MVGQLRVVEWLRGILNWSGNCTGISIRPIDEFYPYEMVLMGTYRCRHIIIIIISDTINIKPVQLYGKYWHVCGVIGLGILAFHQFIVGSDVCNVHNMHWIVSIPPIRKSQFDTPRYTFQLRFYYFFVVDRFHITKSSNTHACLVVA